MRFKVNTVVVDDSDERFILVGLPTSRAASNTKLYTFSVRTSSTHRMRCWAWTACISSRTAKGSYGGLERVELYPGCVQVLISGELAV